MSTSLIAVTVPAFVTVAREVEESRLPEHLVISPVNAAPAGGAESVATLDGVPVPAGLMADTR